MTLYDFNVNGLLGENFDWNTVKGKKILLVNVASECGLTPQYTELEHLQQEFGGDQFTVIGIPSNDFGGQEPGSAEEIATFCSKNYGVTFPILEKMQANNAPLSPLFSWLTEETKEAVAWNFQKFLINENGVVIKTISPQTSPSDDEIVSWIKG